MRKNLRPQDVGNYRRNLENERISRQEHRDNLYRLYLHGLAHNKKEQKRTPSALAGIGKYGAILEQIFLTSNSIKIFEKNLDKNMWNSKYFADCVEHYLRQNKPLKLVLNEYFDQSEVSSLIEEQAFFDPQRIDIKITNEKFNPGFRLEKVNRYSKEGEDCYFVLGDNDKFIFRQGEGILFSFSGPADFDLDYIHGYFDNMFEKAKPLEFLVRK